MARTLKLSKPEALAALHGVLDQGARLGDLPMQSVSDLAFAQQERAYWVARSRTALVRVFGADSGDFDAIGALQRPDEVPTLDLLVDYHERVLSSHLAYLATALDGVLAIA